MGTVAFVLFLAGLFLYFLTPEERRKLLQACWTFCQERLAELLRRVKRRPDETGDLPPAIAFATWFIVFANLAWFVRMAFGGASPADGETLVSWGGSFGPRTTNGEWWRLVTATFVHGSVFHLLAVLAGLIQVGVITERLVGPFAFICVYVAAGSLANLVGLSRAPVHVLNGGSSAVFGVYGLFVATLIWSMLRGARVRIPWRTAKRMMPAVAVFLIYSAATGRLDRVVIAAAAAAGAITGLLLAKDAKDHRPAVRRVVIVTADTAALIMLCAVPLRGMADVRPEIRQVLAVEARTAQAYDAAVVRFTKGSIRAAALAHLIDGTILPDLRAAGKAIDGLQRVPSEHQMTVARAREYLRLRDESWRVRSEALRTGRPHLLKEADRRQWQALNVLETIKDPDEKR